MFKYSNLLDKYNVVDIRNAEYSADKMHRALALLAKGQREQRAVGKALMSDKNIMPHSLLTEMQRVAYQHIEDANTLITSYKKTS
jgi:hypothetical protein